MAERGSTAKPVHRLEIVGVGPQRTGTTWLDACLREHPALCLPAETKETFFLDRHFERGWGWHARFFERCGEDRLRTEIGTTWFDVPAAAERLRARSPACRIVVTLRDPAERSWSLYRHHRRKGRAGDDFRRAAGRIPRIVEASRYAEHLPRWLEAFGRERVHVILLDDVRARPGRVLDDLCGFLAVAPFDDPPAAARERVNPAREARSRPLARLATGASRWLRDRGLHAVADAAGRALGGLVYREGGGKERLPAELRAELVAEFEPDVGYVEELLDRPLPGWSRP